jgi:hypothetical protein
MDSYLFHIRKSKKDESLIWAYNYDLDEKVEGENKQIKYRSYNWIKIKNYGKIRRKKINKK